MGLFEKMKRAKPITKTTSRISLEQLDIRIQEFLRGSTNTLSFRGTSTPLSPIDQDRPIFRQISGIWRRGNKGQCYINDGGCELYACQRDSFEPEITLIPGEIFQIIAPYRTGHSNVDSTIEAVRFAMYHGFDYVVPNDLGKEVEGLGFVLEPYFMR